MKFNRSAYLNTRRDAWIEINLDYIEQNVREVKKFLQPNSKLLAVAKADAYGHGSVMLAPSFIASGVDVFGVASIDEGVQLREAGIEKPILVLGAVPVWSVTSATLNDITISIFSEAHIEACKVAYEQNGIKTKAHVKIDTGMNRIGVCYKRAVDFIKKVQATDFIELSGVFTHFACAEDIEKTKLQIDKFNSVIENIDTKGLLIHTNNTAAILSKFNQNTNMSRAGIALYGLMPDLAPEFSTLQNNNFKQAIALKARIVNIHNADKNEGVSYSHTYQTSGSTQIATIPLGYADGVSRKLSNKLVASLNGKLIHQIGNITMDQMMFDITDVEAKAGDIVTLLGEDDKNFLSINDWAKELNTINYELTCRLKVRLGRVYVRL